MAEQYSHIKKSRYIVVISVLLFFIGISTMVLMFTNHTNTMLDRAVEEADDELNFLTGLVKKAYLGKDYVGIEKLM